MRRSISISVPSVLFAASMVLTAAAADKPAHPPKKPDATVEKVKALGDHLGRALDLALELLSGNEVDLLSKNNTNLLSGNKAALLSGNSPKLLSGNAPQVLSGNTTPIFSGNTFSLLSNIKVDIHIEKSGNTVTAPSGGGPNVTRPQGYLTPTPVPTLAPNSSHPTVPGPNR